jgi:hypothetical protein
MTLIVMLIAVVGTAGEVEFSLDLDGFKWTPNQDVRTRARLAQWNDPMGRMMYHFNQQQAWIMRGTMPGRSGQGAERHSPATGGRERSGRPRPGAAEPRSIRSARAER